MDSAYYKQARDKALRDYRDVVRRLHELNLRKAQLRETIQALDALCSRLPKVESLSLSNALRLVFSNTGTFLTVLEIRGKLQELGYNISRYKNPLASIHTALERMTRTDELIKRDDEDQKKFEAGKNLKKPPIQIQSSLTDIDLVPETPITNEREDKILGQPR